MIGYDDEDKRFVALAIGLSNVEIILKKSILNKIQH